MVFRVFGDDFAILDNTACIAHDIHKQIAALLENSMVTCKLTKIDLNKQKITSIKDLEKL